MIGALTFATIYKIISITSFSIGAGGMYLNKKKNNYIALQEIAATSEVVAIPESILSHQIEPKTQHVPKVNIRAKEEVKEEWRARRNKKTVVIEDERVKKVIKGLIMQGTYCLVVAIVCNEVSIVFNLPFAMSHGHMLINFMDSGVEFWKLAVNIIRHW